MDLLHAASHAENLGDTRNRLQAAGDGPVSEGAEFAWLHGSGGIGDSDEHDFSHERRNWGHVGTDAFGKIFGRSGQSLLHELAGLIDVRSPVEFDED